MTQSFRRILLWTLIAGLLLLGTMLQLKASPVLRSPDGPAHEKAQEALAQGFGCTISLLSFRLPQAEQMCGKTIELLPNDPIGYKFRGYTYLLEHRFERAEADFREAVKLDPRDPENQAGLGQSFSGQGRFDEATQKFTAALAVASHDVRYLAARCWAQAGQGKNLASAKSDCDLAIRLAPRSGVAYDARALVELKQRKYDMAIRDYSASLSIDKSRPTALFGRGIAEWREELTSAARADLSRARQGDPEIDETYILVGVLEADCRTGGEACSLPKSLRPVRLAARPYVSVSYRGHARR